MPTTSSAAGCGSTSNGAKAAFARLARRAGMTPTEAAWGVHHVVNENMAQAARMHMIERNWDPRG